MPKGARELLAVSGSDNGVTRHSADDGLLANVKNRELDFSDSVLEVANDRILRSAGYVSAQKTKQYQGR